MASETGRASGDRPTATPRLLMPSERADVRITWYGDAGRGLVLSLWHGNVCAASAPLSPADAGRLADFLTARLAELQGGAGPSSFGDEHPG